MTNRKKKYPGFLEQEITRREFLKKAAVGALGISSAVLFSCVETSDSAKRKSAANEKRENPLAQKPPVIYVTNDIHLLSESLHDDGPNYNRLINQRDGKFTEFIDSIVQAFVAAVIRDKPDILIVSGDLTFNGEKTSHEDLAAYLAQIQNAGIKVYVVPGNHDIQNPFSAAFFDFFAFQEDYVSPADFQNIYRSFGYGSALSRDKTTLSYIAQPMKGLRLLMLDSCKYKRNIPLEYPEPGGYISAETQKWILTNVRKAQKDGCTVVAAMHHSSMDHHPAVNEDFTLDNSEEIREFLSSLGVSFILTGHIHAQSISERSVVGKPAQNELPVGSQGAQKFYDVATSALAVFPHQFGVLKYQPANERSLVGGAQDSWHYAVQALDVQDWAQSTHQTNKRLLDFSAQSEAFFTRNAESMVTRRIAQTPVNPEEIAALTQLIAAVNTRYFSGTALQNGQDVYGSSGYALLQSGRFDSLKRYVDTIIVDPPPANNNAVFPASRHN